MVPTVLGETGPHAERLDHIGDLIVDRYRLESEIGSGGMGVVYKAYRDDVHAYVAIKLLQPASVFDLSTVERFMEEARTVAALQSPNVARVQDFGLLPGNAGAGLYIATEYLNGQDLAEVLKSGPLGLSDSIDYSIQASHAIAEAHEHGIVHRALKPANLFRNDEGDIKVLDFGIANPAPSASSRSVHASRSLRSLRYFSPEQLEHPHLVDARADIYSFGVCLYELLTGSVPFAGRSFGELSSRILRGAPVRLEQLRPDLPDGLAAVVHRAFARESNERFQRLGDFVSALAPYAPPRSRRLIDLFAEQSSTAAPLAKAPAVVPSSMPLRIERTASLPVASPHRERDIGSRFVSRRSVVVYAALALILLLFAAKIWTRKSAIETTSRARLAAHPVTSTLGVLQANVPAPEPLPPSAAIATASPPFNKPTPP